MNFFARFRGNYLIMYLLSVTALAFLLQIQRRLTKFYKVKDAISYTFGDCLVSEEEELDHYIEGFNQDKVTRNDATLRVIVSNDLMSKPKESEKARKLIEELRYLTLATTNKVMIPWSAPLLFAHDKDYNFYWRCSRKTVHSTDIEENDNVAFTIYNSTLPKTEVYGVYVRAKAHVLVDEKEIEDGLRLIMKKEKKPMPPVEEYMPGAPKAVYKAVPIAVWINDLADKGEDILKYLRLEIKLK